jgi:hypothetical protein
MFAIRINVIESRKTTEIIVLSEHMLIGEKGKSTSLNLYIEIKV